MSWGNEVLLETDEKVVESWEGSRILIEKAVSQNSSGKEKEKETKVKSKEWRKGYLVLTNHRLLFIDEKKQRIEEPNSQIITIPLRRVAEMWRDKTPVEIKSPQNTETFVFQLPKVGKKEYDKFKELIIYYSQNKAPSKAENKL